jgi:hypothetical protein
MILPNLVFDVLLFGLMAVAVAVDALLPVTHGAATLIVLGFVVFLAAEDAAHLARRFGWGQESYASGIAVSLFGFIYFWWRNQSDTAATALHICLMLSALMVLIGTVAAFSHAWKERSIAPIIGLVATKIAALLLGGLGGLCLLFLSSSASLPLKLAVVAAALIGWRLRVQKKPPVSTVETEPAGGVHAPAPRVLLPQGGTALDRALPLVLLGAVASFIAR